MINADNGTISTNGSFDILLSDYAEIALALKRAGVKQGFDERIVKYLLFDTLFTGFQIDKEHKVIDATDFLANIIKGNNDEEV